MGNNMLARYGLIVTCIAAGIFGRTAHAQAGNPAALQEAAQALSAKINAATRSGKMAPRLNDPDFLVRNGFDRAAIRALPNDPSILKTCQSVGGALGSYDDYTTKRANGSELDPDVQRKRQVVLQDERILGLAAADLCSKRMLLAVKSFMANLSPAERRDPIRLKAAAAIRDNMTLFVLETVKAQSASDVRPGNLALLHESTLEMADVGAEAMTQDQRADIRATIDTVIKDAPASSTATLRRLWVIYSRVGCTGLCAMR